MATTRKKSDKGRKATPAKARRRPQRVPAHSAETVEAALQEWVRNGVASNVARILGIPERTVRQWVGSLKHQQRLADIRQEMRTRVAERRVVLAEQAMELLEEAIAGGKRVLRGGGSKLLRGADGGALTRESRETVLALLEAERTSGRSIHVTVSETTSVPARPQAVSDEEEASGA